MKEILKLNPIFKDYIWGGKRLEEDFGFSNNGKRIAEAWFLSGHITDSNSIQNEELNLRDYIKKHKRDFLGTQSPLDDELPILIKMIDAAESLSVQVHPDDEYAQKNGEPFGKNEMWYIVDTDDNNHIVYGVNDSYSKNEIRNAISEDNLMTFLKQAPIQKGDSIFIKAGTIHAIQKGTLVFEVQQSSDTTYRLYDYGRKDDNGNLRDLHIEESLDVSHLKPLPIDFSIAKTHNKADNELELENNDYFQIHKIQISSNYTLKTDTSSFVSLVFIEGEGIINTPNQTLTFKKGDSFVLPAQNNTIEISGIAECIISHL